MPRCGSIVVSFAVIVGSAIADGPVDADVVVVGAGYAGLSAARDLHAAGLTVRVIEANTRPGGSTLNQNLSDVGVGMGILDLGAEWLSQRKENPYAWQLIKDELGFDIMDQSAKNEELEEFLYTSKHPEGVRMKSDGTGFVDAFGAKALAEVTWIYEELTRLKLLLPLMGAKRLDNMTFETWLQEHHLSADAYELIRVMVALDDVCAEPSKYSALAAVKVDGGLDFLKEMSDGTQYRVKGGLAAPALHMARELGQLLHLGAPVTTIAQDDAGVLVQARLKDGPSLQVRAKRVLFSGPPRTTLKVEFTPPLPSEKRRLYEKLPKGNLVKAQLVYSTPFWKDIGFDGTILSTVDLDNSPSSCMDNTPLDSDLGVLLCTAAGNFSENLMRKSRDQRRDVIASFLARSFGEQAKSPIHYSDYDWTAEPYIGGASNVVFEPGALTQYGNLLTEDFKHVSWIGSDVSTPIAGPQSGYVEGAVQSGREAAKRLIQELKGIVPQPVEAVLV